jgi:dihydrolipoamide dehydrogenase
VSPGDPVAKDQAVLELETDHATIEVPSNVAGTVKDVRVKQGVRITVGQVVLTLDD